jgi:Family of unknown function (DUF5677)
MVGTLRQTETRMGKGKRNREKRRREAERRHSSSLGEHRRHKKTLTPPLASLPNMKPVSWQHESLPDFLWLRAIKEETGFLPAPHEALDVLDRFVAETTREEEEVEARTQAAADSKPHLDLYLDGRLSTFALVPPDRRAEARQALRDEVPWALPDELGHALMLYLECPAAWLYEDWIEENEVDRDIGTAYLKRLVEPLLDPRGRPSSQLRLLPLARLAKHGKLHFADGRDIVELLRKYPTYLDREHQLRVEQWARATWNAFGMMFKREVAEAWCRHFWEQNWKISSCDPEPEASPPPTEDEAPEERPSEADRGRRPPTVSEVQRGFVQAVDTLGDALRQEQHRIEIDLYDRTPDEVKLGLASRMFRLLRHFAADPDLWTNEMGPHVFRSLIDARIVVAWLLKQDDRETFERFKDYGLGKRKLFKLQLEELMDREDLTDEDDEALHKRLEAEVNQDVMEEFVKIDLGGSFSSKNIRQMANETDLAELYSLSYQPLSSEAHGEWSSLIAFDLRHCGNPLHRWHRLGTFDTSPEVVVHFGWVRQAFNVAEAAIIEIFASSGIDVRPLFEKCLEQMNEARKYAAPAADEPA